MELKNLNSKSIRRTFIFEKPSGTVAIGGDLDKLERKFYNGILHNTKNQLEKDINKTDFKIPLQVLIENLNASENDKHNKYYKKLLDKLFATSVYYNMLKKDKNIIVDGKAHLIDNLDYETNKQTGEIVVLYTIPRVVRESMIDIIQGNPNGIYAKIDLMIIKGLKSKYSIILYELCKDYEKAEIPEMTMEQFKEIFGIEDKKAYNFFPNIVRFVLTPAIDEINKNKDINFMVGYNLTKRGNAYTHIKFVASRKPNQKQLEEYKEFSQNNILIDAVPQEHRTKALETYLAKCLKNRDAKYLFHQIEYVNSQKPKNYFAYLKKAIEEDYANNEKADIEEKKDIIKQKYQDQIARIRKLKEEKGKVKLRERQGNVFYFSGVSFDEEHLVIYEDMKKSDDEYSNSVYVTEIKLDDEKTIQNALNIIEEKLSDA